MTEITLYKKISFLHLKQVYHNTMLTERSTFNTQFRRVNRGLRGPTSCSDPVGSVDWRDVLILTYFCYFWLFDRSGHYGVTSTRWTKQLYETVALISLDRIIRNIRHKLSRRLLKTVHDDEFLMKFGRELKSRDALNLKLLNFKFIMISYVITTSSF